MELTATTSPFGAGKWKPKYASFFNAKQSVVVLRDNDEPGRKHQLQQLSSLHGKVASLKKLDLPGLPEKGDVTDWVRPKVREGRSLESIAEELCALADGAPEWKPDPSSPSPVPSQDPLVLNPSDPLPSARLFVETLHIVDGIRGLQHQGRVFYQFRRETNAYIPIDEAAIRSSLYEFLEPAIFYDEKGIQRDFKPTKTKVENVVDALQAVTNLPESCTPPCWLNCDSKLNPLEILACQNGLLHIPTRRILEPTPQFFTHNGLEFPFNPKAPEPELWLRFLEQLWPEDAESRETLQEWIGYLLTPQTRLQKIMMLVGPPRSGKGTIAHIIERLLGRRNVCGPTLSNMAEQFGLASLIGKSVAIIADARLSGRADAAVVTERLLSISGEDTLSIPRKFLPDWTGQLSTRFMLLTNELPCIEDVSGALASRFIILALRQSFYGREDHQLLEKLIPELSGILLWAIDGWDHLQCRGRFIQPSSERELVQEFEDLGSPIRVFLRTQCETGTGFEAPQERVFKAWKGWCEQNGRKRPGTVQSFAKDLRAAAPWLKTTRPRIDGVQIRHWKGLRLRGNDADETD